MIDKPEFISEYVRVFSTPISTIALRKSHLSHHASKNRSHFFDKSYWKQLQDSEKRHLSLTDCYQQLDFFLFSPHSFYSNFIIYHFLLLTKISSYYSPFVKFALGVDPAFYHHVKANDRALVTTPWFQFRKSPEFIPYTFPS